MHVAGVSGVGTHPDASSALARMGCTGVVTSHAFRTLFSTCANEAGWNSDVIEKATRATTPLSWQTSRRALPRHDSRQRARSTLNSSAFTGTSARRFARSNRYKAGSFERSLAEGKSHNFAVALPGHLAEQAEEAPKSSYNLEFLGIQKQVKERELEDHLIARLRDFILELGYGFCFIGHQQSSSR